MKSLVSGALRQICIICAVALAWWAGFHLNLWMFAAVEHSPVASWVFLPAALRLVAMLLFNEVGAMGLVLGAYLTVHHTGGNMGHEIVLSASSGASPYMAVIAGRRMFGIPQSLAGLKAQHIVILSVSCAAANALLLNGYLWLAGRLHGDLLQVATIFVGDVTGAAIVLFALSLALSFAMPRGDLGPRIKPH